MIKYCTFIIEEDIHNLNVPSAGHWLSLLHLLNGKNYVANANLFLSENHSLYDIIEIGPVCNYFMKGTESSCC